MWTTSPKPPGTPRFNATRGHRQNRHERLTHVDNRHPAPRGPQIQRYPGPPTKPPRAPEPCGQPRPSPRGTPGFNATRQGRQKPEPQATTTKSVDGEPNCGQPPRGPPSSTLPACTDGYAVTA